MAANAPPARRHVQPLERKAAGFGGILTILHLTHLDKLLDNSIGSLYVLIHDPFEEL
jgi:hypothetical protein